VEDQSSDHLLILKQLALEYQQKYGELEQFVRNTEPQRLLIQLRNQGELATSRFRSFEVALLMALSQRAGEQDGDATLRLATDLCRCFDEMRILFQFLLEYNRESAELT